ncbi:MAG TPA: GNAT family N-acetyltransferase [Ktedonobacterales bacterium]|nr:GNAT family N-acetyltransferase [Ktedonobacterales bacterium]
MSMQPQERPEGPAEQGTVAQVPLDAERLTHTMILRDGSHVLARPIRPHDTERLRAFHAHLSMDTIYFRFFRVVPTLSEEQANWFTHVDYERRMALVATVGEGAEEQIVAVVRYDRTDAETAEAAFVVRDDCQGHGIATALLLRLAEYARGRGLKELVAETMASNAKMLEVLRHCGYPCTMRFVEGDIEARLDITQTPLPSFEAGI